MVKCKAMSPIDWKFAMNESLFFCVSIKSHEKWKLKVGKQKNGSAMFPFHSDNSQLLCIAVAMFGVQAPSSTLAVAG